MVDYHVFGNCLRSELEFPELPQVGNGEGPRWTLALARKQEALPASDPLGEDEVSGDIRVRLYRVGGGLRLDYDDTGCFDIAAGGDQIRWFPGPDNDLAKVRADVLGRVLAAAMHSAGLLCLHGSAVALASGAVAFIAPKFHGKSTLAVAAVAAGARLITDDSLPIDLSPPARALPGVHNVRLWTDSFRRLGRGDTRIKDPQQKRVLRDWSPDCLVSEPLPLSAIYLLSPLQAQLGVDPVRRQRLSVLQASLSLVGQSKIGALLGKSEAPVLLDRATALAQQVPVYVLRMVRAYKELNAVTHQLLEWHGGPGMASPPHVFVSLPE